MIVCGNRAADRSVEDFRDWPSHGRLRSVQLPGLVRLVESTTSAAGYRGREPLYDAIDA